MATNFISDATSVSLRAGGYARCARLATIFSTHACPDLGSQIRIFLRLAFSTLDGNGPTKVMEPMYLFFLLL